MSAPKHTLGPWYSENTAGREIHGQIAIASEANGETVALAYDGEANAALIAAAPEMLEALIAAEERILELSHFAGITAEGQTLTEVRAAIAKAEGGGA